MISGKKLRNATYSTAQHAVSGLCFIHPHIGDACLNINERHITLDLINLTYVPSIRGITKELSLSSKSLQTTFIELLKKQSIEITDIEEAYIKFFFYEQHYPSGAYIYVKAQGVEAEHAVDALGVTAEVIHENS